MSRNGYGFYNPLNRSQNVSVCQEFLKGKMGVISDNVSIELSTIRPHQKGWHRIDITQWYKILLDGIETHISTHSRLRNFLSFHQIGNVFWIRVTEL